ncbi:hypothetical protein [Streptomyces fuscichromogenes]|uniref:Uncharacterized protein n=1 Tax=Streptomyces fuscichromogenes TaxID=1324013 RepID=A0A917XQR3_9ACTN|nr:hypothetical protein [Streptomyces fuscichromogenes]GGN46341.1 hypothetical protein GCM10011578_099170 [Streptomyces fuscichromogenes]
MARSPRKPVAPTKPLLKSPVRIGKLDTKAIIGELRQLHEDAEDESVGLMPADEELFGALLHLEANAGALKSEEARRKAAIKRVMLWEYLREQADLHQAKAIEQARADGIEWADLVPALAVNAPSAAYNKAKRLQAAVLTEASQGDPPVRRTPEAVRDAKRQAAARAAVQRRAEAEAARRHAALAPVAQRLLDHRAGLDDDEDVSYWLDQVAAVLPSCQTPTQLVSLQTYMEAVVRELRRKQRETGKAAASTPEALLAYAMAAEVTAG